MVNLKNDDLDDELDDDLDDELDDDLDDDIDDDLDDDIDDDFELADNSNSFYMTQSEIGRYLVDIHKFPRLSAEEEIELSAIIQVGLLAKEQLTEDNKNELLPLIEAGQQAREKFINANYKLVVALAKRFFKKATPSFTVLDIIQSGNLGLMTAVERYDGTKGFKFSTYATNWILQSIRRDLVNVATTIRLPVHRQDLINKIYTIENNEGKKTNQELAEKLDISLKRIEDIKHFRDTNRIVYLDNISKVLEEEHSLLDVVPSTILSPAQVADIYDQEEYLYNLLLTELTDREHYVINRRFGLVDGQSATLEVIGDELGVTRERVRQIEVKALRKLRSPKNERRIKALLYKS